MPSGWGEFRAPTGATIYEGEWSRGLRHGAGTLYFETGDEWRGTFHPVCKSNLQPDFNVRVFECFDTSSSAVLRDVPN